jgi:uncharacterized membrane protein YhaH (DUF805 family)
MFKNSFSFTGRISRTEYGLSFILYFITYAIILGFIETGGDISGLFMIPALWFFWAQGAKRCHDRGNSGWWQIIPFYGLWMLFGNSEKGENEYGVNPKEISNVTIVPDAKPSDNAIESTIPEKSFDLAAFGVFHTDPVNGFHS